MILFNQLIKITGHIFFVITIIFFSTLHAKNIDKFNKANNIANYFSGILLLNESKYADSYEFLKKLDGLEQSHGSYSSKYLYSLANSGKFNQAFKYAKKLEKKQQGNFESDLIIGIYHLKNSNNELSTKFFLKAKKRKFRSLLDIFIAESLYILSNLENEQLSKSLINIRKLDERFDNLKKIKKVFVHCYFKSSQTRILFDELTKNQKTDFSRYNYFYANYLYKDGKIKEAKKIIENSLIKYPRNLLLNQYKLDLESSKKNFDFNCSKKEHIAAEMLYIAANALSSQSIYPLSNIYLNFSKYLNQDFHTFDTLIAENFYKIENYDKAKKIYEKLTTNGTAFEWYSIKQISRILIQEKRKDKSLKLLKKSYDDLPVKGVYETFDYAEFLKNNEEFKESIKYYTIILKQIKKNHQLFPEVTDSRGVAYERVGEWAKAEKDLIESLKAKPNQAYVINYLAYSWIEKGVKIEKSLEMLRKANKLKSNDPYIIDSLGWALFKLERYEESKEYLQLALRLMPADPIVNDHYGDVLWKNGNKIQARYYWRYVLSLEKTEKDLKKQVEKKLVKGL